MIKFILALLLPVMAFADGSFVSTGNSSTTPLAAGATFTGEGILCYNFSSVIASAKTDQAGSLYIDFSSDNTNWDRSVSFAVTAATGEAHRATITNKYCRTRFVNTSASAQTYFRFQTIFSSGAQVNSPMSANVPQDADAIVTKAMPGEILMAEGKMLGYTIVNKFGYNPDIDTAAGEDIWGGDGYYAGFPAAAENLSVLSSSASDAAAGTGARTGTVLCLDSNYNQVTVNFTLNGTTPVNTGVSVLRCHSATIATVGSGGVNVGQLTFRHVTTTTNVFLVMLAGRNQTNCSCYTVPAGKKAYMRSIHVSVGDTGTNAVEGNIWHSTFGGPFRSRRPFFASTAFRLYDVIFGGLQFTEKSDIVLRVNVVSTNNTKVNGGYDLILVDQ